MMHRPIALALLLAIVTPATGASAQRPVTLTVGGGASLPVGAFADGVGTGWHALAGLGVSSLMQPIGIRLDVAHDRFPGDADVDQAITSGTLNLSYRMPMTNSPLSPYVIAGAGAYHARCSGVPDCGSQTRAGWNAGLGTRFAAFRLKGFAEARFHAAGGARFVPLTLGLML